MRIAILAIVGLAAGGMAACGGIFQTQNSVSGDPETYASPSPSSGSAEYQAARAIFQKECASCHSAFGSYSEAQWVSNGYVVAGKPAESKVYRKLRGSNTGGDENMPPSGALSADSLAKIRAWIESVK